MKVTSKYHLIPKWRRLFICTPGYSYFVVRFLASTTLTCPTESRRSVCPSSLQHRHSFPAVRPCLGQLQWERRKAEKRWQRGSQTIDLYLLNPQGVTSCSEGELHMWLGKVRQGMHKVIRLYAFKVMVVNLPENSPQNREGFWKIPFKRLCYLSVS